MEASRGDDGGIGKRKFHLVSYFSRRNCYSYAKINDISLLHERDSLQRSIFAPLLKDPFKYFEDADGGDEQFFGIFNGWSEKAGIGTIRKIFNPPQESTRFISGLSRGLWLY